MFKGGRGGGGAGHGEVAAVRHAALRPGRRRGVCVCAERGAHGAKQHVARVPYQSSPTTGLITPLAGPAVGGTVVERGSTSPSATPCTASSPNTPEAQRCRPRFNSLLLECVSRAWETGDQGRVWGVGEIGHNNKDWAETGQRFLFFVARVHGVSLDVGAVDNSNVVTVFGT